MTDVHQHNHHKHHDHHGHHENHHHGDFKTIFIRSLPIGLIIMILSPMMGITLPFQFTFAYSDLLVGALATVLLIYGGKPFFQGAVQEFQQKSLGMMALVSLGLAVSYLYSIYTLIARYLNQQMVMDFFFEFASLILIMLLGHWIEMKALGQAQDAQQALAQLIPKQAQLVLEDHSIVEVEVSALKIGDVIRVQAGENIAADGTIVVGNSRVNESLLTGESKPVEKNSGDFVIGGSTNGEGLLFIRIEQMGEQSFIAQVRTLIQQAQSQPSRAENMAHKVAGWLFYIAVGVALLAFVIWISIRDFTTATQYLVTTLVIACPHALGLAIPLVVARSTSLGAQRGLLVKNRQALELASRADVMILDKTGTLTTGEFKVLDIEVLEPSHTRVEIIGLMAGLEMGSSHPIAQSILAYAQIQAIVPLNVVDLEVISGAGVKGRYQEKEYQLISEKAFGQPLSYSTILDTTVSVLIEEGKPIGLVFLGDEIKPTSMTLIQSLKNRHIQPLMATGDNRKAAQKVAQHLGMSFLANQSPQDKYKLIEQKMRDNQTVIMVGDGINDAPSLALADVGVAIGAGTQVALDSADIILTQSDPADVQALLMLSAKTNTKMRQNLWWGAGYNFVAIPLAAGLLAPLGLSLTPAIGAILMSLSTIIVAINAMALKLD